MEDYYLLIWDLMFKTKELGEFYGHKEKVMKFNNEDDANEYFNSICRDISNGVYNNENETVKSNGGTIHKIDDIMRSYSDVINK